MKNVLNFYMDDSGIRYPTHNPGRRAAHGHDWFALGGVIVRDDDEASVRSLYDEFCKRWKITVPLHSSEIRSQNKGFLWLRSQDQSTRDEFYESLYQLMKLSQVIGLACVIDRPGYNNRYLDKYEQQPWLLCKTAFSVVVERAAKYASINECRLRVSPERCNKSEDSYIKNYYDALKNEGMPFASNNSSQYSPLSSIEFTSILYELSPKNKSSPMAQLADLFLWPICMGGYGANRPYDRLRADGKLIEDHIPADSISTIGTKYSCFELEQDRLQTKKAPSVSAGTFDATAKAIS